MLALRPPLLLTLILVVQTQLSTESQEKQALTRQLLVVDGELTRLKTSQESELRALMQTNRDLTAKVNSFRSASFGYPPCNLNAMYSTA